MFLPALSYWRSLPRGRVFLGVLYLAVASIIMRLAFKKAQTPLTGRLRVQGKPAQSIHAQAGSTILNLLKHMLRVLHIARVASYVSRLSMSISSCFPSRPGSASRSLRSIPVYVFIDHSNIIGDVALTDQSSSRIASLFAQLTLGRPVALAVVVGRMSDLTRKTWKNLNCPQLLIKRMTSERRQNADGWLHTQLYNTINAASEASGPAICVLGTGDGNSNGGGTTFPDCVVFAIEQGWLVEVVGWRLSSSKKYPLLKQQYPKRLTLRYFSK
jgi:hypothetical protein